MFQKKMKFRYSENYDVSIGMRKYSNTLQIRLWPDLAKVCVMLKWKSYGTRFNTNTRLWESWVVNGVKILHEHACRGAWRKVMILIILAESREQKHI